MSSPVSGASGQYLCNQVSGLDYPEPPFTLAIFIIDHHVSNMVGNSDGIIV